MTTPDTQIPTEIRQMLARARPEQLARLLRDIKTEAKARTEYEGRHNA